MIVRAVLKNPELIDKLDFFNDGKDTVQWLRECKQFDLADRLQKQLDEWRERKRAEALAECEQIRADAARDVESIEESPPCR